MSKKQTASPNPGQEQVQPPAQEALPIHLDVRVRPIAPKGNLLGYADATINGSFAVRGIKVVSGKNGLFANMPSIKGGDGQFREVCFPVSKEFHKQLQDAVADGYQQAIEQMREAALKAQEQAQAPEEAPGMEMAME